MTKKIFTSIISVAVVSLLASAAIIMGCLYGYFESVQENGMKDELSLAITGVEDEGVGYLENIHSNRRRLTWIAADGTVLYDTVADAGNSENHLERAEVKSAIETGEGYSNRYSQTVLEKTMYYAKRMKDGSVLRISVSSASVGRLALDMLQPILVIVFAAMILSGILAGRVSKRIVRPLNHLNLEQPLENEAYEEISPLLNRIHRQRNEINAQFVELRRREEEFAQITACMREGLILLDQRGIVLSINPAANRIFALGQDSAGKDFLTICRDREMSLCIEGAMASGHGEIQQSRDGREYQFDVSRIESAGQPIGAAILMFDITERVLAERTRREFTANASHELKTPLQGIMGSAELIENGMVQPEDLPRFVGHIRKEASRLVTLVGDIIRLSQLDERAELLKEEVDLLEVAGEVSQNLRPIAEEKKVALTVSGEHVALLGVRNLLYEIMFNLCENGIKYNREGGSVALSIARDGDMAVLTVTDTGIGIPREHLDRVFERFYRVDKSHSKESGGTGLGLSIVKHAVAYCRGTVDLQSVVGKGTNVRIEMPVGE